MTLFQHLGKLDLFRHNSSRNVGLAVLAVQMDPMGGKGTRARRLKSALVAQDVPSSLRTLRTAVQAADVAVTEPDLSLLGARCLVVSQDRHFIRSVGTWIWQITGKTLAEVETPEPFFSQQFGSDVLAYTP